MKQSQKTGRRTRPATIVFISCWGVYQVGNLKYLFPLVPFTYAFPHGLSSPKAVTELNMKRRTCSGSL